MKMLKKQVQLRFTAAEPMKILNQLADAGIVVLNVFYIDMLTVDVVIHKRNYLPANHILEKNCAQLKSVKQIGIYRVIYIFQIHPILVISLMMYLIVACVIPNRILFLKVEGNQKIPDKRILESAEAAGIRFGSRSKLIRSEEVKNRMLAQLPDLQWVGINTSGCVATIHVEERNISSKNEEGISRISNVVALRDGIITNMSVRTGMPLVELGDSVKAGDVLVSGYSDYGLKIVAQNADAEVMGYTTRKYTFVTPIPIIRSREMQKKHVCYRLRIGKKVINFCNHSGILDALCVKMYSEDYWALPGGFRLPVSLTRVMCIYYDQRTDTVNNETAYQWLFAYGRAYAQKQMIAGQILDEVLNWDNSGECCQLEASYACHEMIGQVKYEEIMDYNAEDN